MAKTIKELAGLAFPTIAEEDKEALEALKYIGIECDNAHEYNSVRKNQQDLYIMGANAVLDELRVRLQEYREDTLGEYFVAYDFVDEVIKQLKGE